ncbi:FAD-dependent oxidoreductase [Azospirillum sp. ST 5-10]|uniref:FAD-dependent oxidoreductase n=1 Tax=unclassified Azospirillum TaxID=2630922 RepID=UPI003F4A09EB
MSESVDRYDVVVAGGGSAGVAAAAAAARSGARTLLIEKFGCLGGASTMRNVVTYCGLYTLGETPRKVVGGIADEVLDGLAAHGALSGIHRHRGVYVVFDPEALKAVLDEVCACAGVEVLLGAGLIGADRAGGRITAVTYADHAGIRRVEAAAFVDCTGDGDLACFGGAATRYGNGGAVNLGTLGTRFGGIPAAVEVTAQDIADAVARLRDRGVDVFTKDRSVVARLPVSHDLVCYVASADYDPRDSASMSAAERQGRRQAWAYLEAIRSIAGCEGAYLVSTGPEFGTRESRHIDSVGQLRWDDVVARRRFADCVALGAWGAEWHDRGDYGSSFDLPPDRATYDIPLSCLRSVDTPNLFAAGRTADGDRKAGAAIRVMGTAFATGQAAGVAAALVADGRDAPAAEVRARLVRQGAMLEDPGAA